MISSRNKLGLELMVSPDLKAEEPLEDHLDLHRLGLHISWELSESSKPELIQIKKYIKLMVICNTN